MYFLDTETNNFRFLFNSQTKIFFKTAQKLSILQHLDDQSVI